MQQFQEDSGDDQQKSIVVQAMHDCYLQQLKEEKQYIDYQYSNLNGKDFMSAIISQQLLIASQSKNISNLQKFESKVQLMYIQFGSRAIGQNKSNQTNELSSSNRRSRFKRNYSYSITVPAQVLQHLDHKLWNKIPSIMAQYIDGGACIVQNSSDKQTFYVCFYFSNLDIPSVQQSEVSVLCLSMFFVAVVSHSPYLQQIEVKQIEGKLVGIRTIDGFNQRVRETYSQYRYDYRMIYQTPQRLLTDKESQEIENGRVCVQSTQQSTNLSKQSSLSSRLYLYPSQMNSTDALGDGFPDINVQLLHQLILNQIKSLTLSQEQEYLQLISQFEVEEGACSWSRFGNSEILVSKIWNDAVDKIIQNGGACMYFLKNYCSRNVLYRQMYDQTLQLLNQYFFTPVKIVLKQNHPVKALSDHISTLMKYQCLDLSLYTINDYHINLLLLAFYVGKNFLKRDNFMSNTCGCIALVGETGSGKSNLVKMLGQYFDGHLMQNGKSGGSDFVNADIGSKSCILVEEMTLEKIIENEWKTVTDLEQDCKFKVKNSPDITVSKCVPVVLTSNNDPYEIFNKADRQQDRAAARRRLGFINFSSRWEQQVQDYTKNLDSVTIQNSDNTYTHATTNVPTYGKWWQNIVQTQGEHCTASLFNTIIGYAVLFSDNLAMMTQIKLYYQYCLEGIINTPFGIAVATNRHHILLMLQRLRVLYNEKSTVEQIKEKNKILLEFQEILTQTQNTLLYQFKQIGVITDRLQQDNKLKQVNSIINLLSFTINIVPFNELIHKNLSKLSHHIQHFHQNVQFAYHLKQLLHCGGVENNIEQSDTVNQNYVQCFNLQKKNALQDIQSSHLSSSLDSNIYVIINQLVAQLDQQYDIAFRQLVCTSERVIDQTFESHSQRSSSNSITYNNERSNISISQLFKSNTYTKDNTTRKRDAKLKSKRLVLS